MLGDIKKLILNEWAADRASDDVTTQSVIGSNQRCEAAVIARESGVFCGEFVCTCFGEQLGEQVSVDCAVRDGDVIEAGTQLIRLEGNARLILGVERTLINFVSHLCGVATLTNSFVCAVSPFPTKILATRKTLPGLRAVQLIAVQAGGGYVHRRSLSDGILIKDNHLAFTDEQTALDKALRLHSPLHGVEIEVQSLTMLEKVLQNAPHVVMLDNMGPDDVQHAVKMINGRARVEVSGGVRLEDVRRLAELGVDYISVGQLTHSARSLNLSLDILKVLPCPES
ncbi:MAG: carboxylating nicotinate-nucleotide diphosphorylase [Deltaproteobacteria bacterium]|nr:carboxylating nicotinate-nucleotide diphosphorylase [Deltaproteobacteria bacterium]